MLNVLADDTARWNREAPASQEAIDSRLSAVPWELPADYLAFLRYSNGGEGVLGINPGWFHIWPVEEVVEANEGYRVAEFCPGYFGFGSSLGGTMFAFKMRESPHKVYGIPFDSIDPADVDIIADDFLSFAKAIGCTLDVERV